MSKTSAPVAIAPIDVDAIVQWARAMAGESARIEVNQCRPGERPQIGKMWDGGIWGGGAECARAAVTFPSTEWAEALAVTFHPAARARPEGYYLLDEPLAGPTLFRVTGAGRVVDGEKHHHRFTSESYLLLIPMGETEEAYQRRTRREFASRQCDELLKLGLSRKQITALFHAASVARAVDGLELARKAEAGCGGRQAALDLLSEVASAPYGREQRLQRLTESGVEHHAPSARRLNNQLSAALAYGRVVWGLEPQ
ncbi:MAG TPA: hypothetical protein VLI05_03445 [Candidatus Saccharimonadia bacterium]|nr:hypothetical protein [Candidatus Saccharimonadia bacterium]